MRLGEIGRLQGLDMALTGGLKIRGLSPCAGETIQHSAERNTKHFHSTKVPIAIPLEISPFYFVVRWTEFDIT